MMVNTVTVRTLGEFEKTARDLKRRKPIATAKSSFVVRGKLGRCFEASLDYTPAGLTKFEPWKRRY